MDPREIDTVEKIIQYLKAENNTSKDMSIYLVKIENEIRALRENSEQTQKSLKELQIKLLDPTSGVIVAVNKNTDWRTEYEQQFEDIQSLIRWKTTADRLIWIIIVALVSIGIKILFL